MTKTTYEVRHKTDKDFKTVEMHSHDFSEVYFFLKGSASYIIEDRKYSLRPGDILLIPPNKLHQLDIKDSTETYERYVLWIDGKYLKKISTPKSNLNTCFLKATENDAFLIRDDDLSDKVRRLLESATSQATEPFGADVETDEKIKSILINLGRFYLQNDGNPGISGKTNPCVTKAIDYISEHITEDLSLDALSSALFVNKFYFAHIFKETTNTSPHRYVLKKRLIISKQLIEQGFPVTEVYLKCGFSDYTHFFRAFKSEYGITPKQFYSMMR